MNKHWWKRRFCLVYLPRSAPRRLFTSLASRRISTRTRLCKWARRLSCRTSPIGLYPSSLTYRTRDSSATSWPRSVERTNDWLKFTVSTLVNFRVFWVPIGQGNVQKRALLVPLRRQRFWCRRRGFFLVTINGQYSACHLQNRGSRKL